jgi:Tfp pilus assembly protein PilO
MNSLQKHKQMIIAVVVFLVVIVAYNYLWKGSQDSLDQGTSAQNIGNDVVSLNQKLQAVTLDQTLFSSAEYTSLSDWSPVLSQGPIGRIDPFAPIGQ